MPPPLVQLPCAVPSVTITVKPELDAAEGSVATGISRLMVNRGRVILRVSARGEEYARKSLGISWRGALYLYELRVVGRRRQRISERDPGGCETGTGEGANGVGAAYLHGVAPQWRGGIRMWEGVGNGRRWACSGRSVGDRERIGLVAHPHAEVAALVPQSALSTRLPVTSGLVFTELAAPMKPPVHALNGEVPVYVLPPVS